MKALTLYDPWATLIARGEKKIETRSWPHSYRGPLAIHTSKKLATRDDLDHFGMKDVKLYPGCVICIVNLVDCFQFKEDSWKSYSRAEVRAGDWTEGRFGFKMEMLKVLENPIPVRGSLGFWNWNYEWRDGGLHAV